jgi:uncharacterized RDD family membrane protein YckC
MDIAPTTFPATNVIEPPTSGAGFAIRAGARILDSLILQALSLFTGFAIGIVVALTLTIMDIDPTITQKMGKLSFIDIAFSVINQILYFTICEYICGASVGKLTFGLQVVTDMGQPISFKDALVRSLAYLIDSILFGGVAYMSMSQSKLNQRYGDKWANTIVVKRSQLSDTQIPVWWKFLVAFAIAGSVYVVFLSLGLVIKLF